MYLIKFVNIPSVYRSYLEKERVNILKSIC